MPHCHVTQPTDDRFWRGRRLVGDTMATPFLRNVAAPTIHTRALSLVELWRVKKEAAAGHAFWAADDLSSFARVSIRDVACGSQLKSLPEHIALLQGPVQWARPQTHKPKKYYMVLHEPD